MGLTSKLKKIYHIVVRRDVLSHIGRSRFGGVGEGSTIYRPAITDNNLKNVFIGANTTLLTGSRIQLYELDGRLPRIIIGDGCYLGYNNTFLAGGNITLANGVLMASNILISSENHSMDPELPIHYMDQPIICKDVEIGEGAWIAERVMIMPGVTIGKKSVIGAGSVVTSSIPDYCIAVGSPARVVKTYDFATHAWVRACK